MAEFNPQQFIEAINNLALVVGNSVPGITQTVANDATDLIKNRIQQEGLDSDGNKFPGYSTKEIPSFFFKGKNLKKLKQDEFGETALEQNDFLSYKKFRELNELQTDYVDMTFTGSMFRSIGIIGHGQEAGLYVVKVGGRDNEAQNKIDWNSLRYKDILRVSKKEEKGFEQTINDELEKVIKQNGF